MAITLYSILMAIITNSLLVVLIYFFRKSKYFIHFFGVTAMSALYLLSFLRMAIPIEFPKSQIIISDRVILPTILDFLTNDFSDSKLDVLVAVLLTVWTAGFLVLGYLRFNRYFKATKKLSKYENFCPEVFQLKADEIAKIIGIKKSVKVVMTENVSSPMTYGFLKPVILLPSRDYTNTELDFILRHECSHIKNNDIWVKLMIELYCCVYWWNPLTYLLKKDLDFCLELQCDRRVTKNLNESDRASYCKVLLDSLKERFSDKYPFLVGTEFSKKQDDKRIMQRFNIILRSDKEILSDKKHSVFFGSLASIIVVTIICLSYIFIWQPHYDLQPEDLCHNDELPGEQILIDNSNSYIYQDESGQYFLHINVNDNIQNVPICAEDIEAGYYNGYTFK